jgi:hypothetical protein
VLSNMTVTATSGGHVVLLGTGLNTGIWGIACTGASPRTGTRIVSQVVTTLGFNSTYLRIMRNDGFPITGTVLINCVVTYELTTQGTEAAERLREAATAG